MEKELKSENVKIETQPEKSKDATEIATESQVNDKPTKVEQEMNSEQKPEAEGVKSEPEVVKSEPEVVKSEPEVVKSEPAGVKGEPETVSTEGNSAIIEESRNEEEKQRSKQIESSVQEKSDQSETKQTPVQTKEETNGDQTISQPEVPSPPPVNEKRETETESQKPEMENKLKEDYTMESEIAKFVPDLNATRVQSQGSAEVKRSGSTLARTGRSETSEFDDEVSDILRDAGPPKVSDDEQPVEESTGASKTIVIMKKTFTESLKPEHEFIPITDPMLHVDDSNPLTAEVSAGDDHVVNGEVKVHESGGKENENESDEGILSKARTEASDLSSEFRRLQYFLENLSSLSELEITSLEEEPPASTKQFDRKQEQQPQTHPTYEDASKGEAT